MTGPSAISACRFAVPQGRRVRAIPVVLGLVALATTFCGLAALIVHERIAAGTEQVLASAGLVLLAAAFLQWRAAWRLWTYPTLTARLAALRTWTFWRRLSVGVFVAYAVTAAIGPAPYIEVAFGTAVVVWLTVWLLPLAASPNVLERWHQWSQARTARRFGRVVFASMLLLIGGEIGLRIQHVIREQGWLGGRSIAAAPREKFELTLVTQPGQRVGQLAQLSPGPFRVAVLVDGPAVDMTQRSGFLARLEQTVPGVKILPVRVPHPWSTRPTDELAAQLSAARPDLVLAMLAVCEDLTRDAAKPSWFDWRQLALAQWAVGSPESPSCLPPASTPGDFESFLHGVAPQLAACRTPIDPTMHSRWQRTYDALEQLVADCRASELPVALVLVPGEFQVNRSLCETLARRGGYSAEQLDVELPQRKLACFAERRQLPLIDLLPSLRLCSQSPYERHAGDWNVEGHSTAAGAIRGWLQSRYGAQLAVAAHLTGAP